MVALHVTRTQNDCMVCNSSMVNRHTAKCPCCGQQLNYAYCEECGSMFLEHADSDETTMLEEVDAD